MYLIRFFGRFIDYPTAIAGAMIMGMVVGIINFDHGFWPAFTAAFKQAAYTFLFGGILIKMLYWLMLRMDSTPLALIVSTTAISILTITLVYLLHSMKGTPKPFFSTLPTIFMAPPGFFALVWRKRKKSVVK